MGPSYWHFFKEMLLIISLHNAFVEFQKCMSSTAIIVRLPDIGSSSPIVFALVVTCDGVWCLGCIVALFIHINVPNTTHSYTNSSQIHIAKELVRQLWARLPCGIGHSKYGHFKTRKWYARRDLLTKAFQVLACCIFGIPTTNEYFKSTNIM